MQLKSRRLVFGDDVRSAAREGRFRLLHIEAGLGLHRIAHRLWAEGERDVARDCLRVAARCELAEAETDLLTLRMTRGSDIARCADVPLGPEASSGPSAPASRLYLMRAACQRGRQAVMHTPLVLACLLSLALGLLVRVPLAGLEALAPRPAPTATGEEIRFLGAVNVRLRPGPSGQSPAKSSTLPGAAEFRAELVPPADADHYVVTLHSARGKQPCMWRIVGTSSHGPPSTASVALRPGELQEVKVMAGKWSSLAVYADPQDQSSNCSVIGGRTDQGRVMSVPAATALKPMSPSSDRAVIPAEASVADPRISAPGPLPTPRPANS
ncbi:hypothetical protein ACQP2F_37245 [Actinoplanes sp. CA-030573]|uniref:hypothetical protein n=1 Tax=Actinoplanes sp. CA-030573 TaxID=3239898 RepID=UPI003D8F8A2D